LDQYEYRGLTYCMFECLFVGRTTIWGHAGVKPLYSASRIKDFPPFID
jgi:hypothetical protein